MKKFNKNLKKLKGNNKHPFSVPEGYFDEFPTKMQERIISEYKEYNWAIKLFKYIKPQFALGFMIVAFAAIAYTTTNYILSNRTTVIDSDLYSRIIEMDPSEFSEQDFIDVLLEEELKVDDHKNEETDFYIHYLMDEDIDYGTLIDELER
ncbi:hypothetical protein ACFLS4_04130 [Bacteroidota bacterium]